MKVYRTYKWISIRQQIRKINFPILFILFPFLPQLCTGQTGDLFATEDPLEITLQGDMRALLNDRGDNPAYHAIQFRYRGRDSTQTSLAVEIKTRGHFRKMKSNCSYPPLLIHFTGNDSSGNALFTRDEKLKLVMPCRGDEYVIREWLVYKIYNLVTPKSFRARLVKLSLDDPKLKKNQPPFYCFLLEEEKQMAARNHSIPVEKKLQPQQLERKSFLIMAVFEYLAGNTDWSVQYLQNIKLLAPDSLSVPTPVPYDFDHAGLVSAPYARPAEELLMKSVRERRYRGFCMEDMNAFGEAITRFNQLKKEIYQIYESCPLIDEKYKKFAVRFLDEFYTTINNPVSLKKEFGYPCDKNGTGNVIIKGLKED